ncbi:MAG: TIGR01777 family protein [Verrucomicrobiales bacterium]|nr:TIGR01777 family protein [Verrucomicrobiales bacterium]
MLEDFDLGMKIGITGASGFVGSAIVAEATERGWTVVAFSRSPEKEIEGVEEVRSFSDLENLDVSGLDSILHLAGEPIVGMWTKEKKRKIRSSRIESTEALVKAITAIPRSRRPQSFICASAIGYYGDGEDQWLDEDADVGFGFLSEVCRDWEAEAEKVSKLGVRLAVPRLGIVFGKEGFLKKLRPVFRAGLGGKLGSGEQWMSWIHVEDLARIFLLCVENPDIKGKVNAVSPEPVKNREFTSVYAEKLNRKAIFPVPKFVLKRFPGGMSSLFLDSQRVDPVLLKAFEFEWKHPSLSDALDAVESKS